MTHDELGKKFVDFTILHNIARRVRGSETHWYFVEAQKAFHSGLYIASALCSFNGIESSIRTLLLYKDSGIDQEDLNNKVLSHGLLLSASRNGLNVEKLAFPGEADFRSKLNNKTSPVEIVRLRNNICHGNLFEFIETVPETETKIFVPENLRETAEQLLNISEEWTKEIDRFKTEELGA